MAHSEAEVGAQANTNGVGTVVVTARMAYHHLRREGTVMDTIIVKYRARIEESCLILTHPTRLSFELTLDEAVELMEFIKVYQAAIAAAQRQTEPSIESVGVDEEFSSDTDGDKVL